MRHHTTAIKAPAERLEFFRQRLADQGAPGDILAPELSAALAARAPAFAERLHDIFMEVPRTRAILEHEALPDILKRNWAGWFAAMFKPGGLSGEVERLWKSGLIHVDFAIDQRFINLAYSTGRAFCHEALDELAPAAKERAGALAAIDGYVDFCILIATDAYLAATTQCDREVVMGVAHQVRNPVMVIGANIARLARQLPEGDAAREATGVILEEAKRLERMVGHVAAYLEVFQRSPAFQVVALDGLLRRALDKAVKDFGGKPYEFEWELDPDHPAIYADPQDMEEVFHHLFLNALEGVDPEDPLIRVASRPELPARRSLFIEVFNTGEAPNLDDDKLFLPFHTDKPRGSGFGLPLARAATAKNLGSFSIAEAALADSTHTGVMARLALPLPSEEVVEATTRAQARGII